MDNFKLNVNDYDCIGFDLDSTLARYQTGNLLELEYNAITNFLVKERRYPGDFLLKPIEPDFILKGLIIDDQLGNILKVGADGTIVQAAHGTKWLKNSEILEYYPTRHKNYIDDFINDPIEEWNRPFHDRLRFSLDYFDGANSLAYARAIDTVEKRGIKKKFTEVWRDIIDSLLYMFVADHFHQNIGGFYPELKLNPKKYYKKCSQNVLNWLRDLKTSGKLLFLISGAYAGAAHLTAVNTLGTNWMNYFDLVIFGAGKPGFFTKKRDFRAIEEFKEAGKVSEEDLKQGGIYYSGNWKAVKTFLTRLCPIPKPTFLYIGDNLIHDIYTPNVHDQIDTIYISEELEAENVFGFTGDNSDKNFLSSNLWGSYFFCNDKSFSYWGFVMINYSKFFVPNIEYLAKFPVNHKFVLKS